ncbi:Septum formation initiator [Azospirillaceae bacterium]
MKATEISNRICSALNRRVRVILGPLLCAVIFAYFVYYGVYGDRGLFELRHLQNEVAKAQVVLEQLRQERQMIEHRSSLMRPDHLDRDMLDERSRQMLNYSHPDDVIVMLPRRNDPAPVVTNPASSIFDNQR